MLKVAMIFSVIALVAGAAIGSVLSYRDYNRDNHFGPYRSDQPLTVDEVKDFVRKRGSAGVPKVEVEGGSVYDFGVMQRNAKGNHTFVIKNVGTGRLELKVTGSTCKCTVGTLQDNSLEPGESTTVDLEWEAKTESRTFGQSAKIRTTDPVVGELSLEVKGTVIDLVAAEPAAWNLGDIASSVPIEVETTLFNHSGRPIEIEKVEWLDDEFQQASETTFVRREIAAEESGVHKQAIEAWDVVSVVRKGLQQGQLNKRLRVYYRNRGDDELLPPMELPLTGRVVGELSVLGGAKLVVSSSGQNRLRLGQVDQGSVLQEKIYIVLRGPKRKSASLKVAKIEPENAIEAEFGEPSERGEMKLFPLIVKTKGDAPEMVRGGQENPVPGTILIESDDPEVAPMAIDVLFRIGKPFGT